MSRVLFAFLLTAIAMPRAALRAAEPPRPGGTFALQSTGTVTLTGSNTYTGSTTLSIGTLQLQGNGATWVPQPTNGGTINAQGFNVQSLVAPPSSNSASAGLIHSGNVSGTGNTVDWTTQTSNGIVTFEYASSPNLYLSGASGPIRAAATQPTPIPAGPVFYIITEGAGIGDNVRSVPCTGKETVMDAVGYVNGISQVSSLKIWIARPALAGRDKGATLPVDWDAISRRGINTTNYTLLPGDRLVFAEDSLVTRTNLTSKKTAPIERINGVVGLTTSTLSGLERMSAAECQLLKKFAQKGVFTDDEEFKQFILDAIQVREEAINKAGPKAAVKQKVGKEDTYGNRTTVVVGTLTGSSSGANTYSGTTTIIGGTLLLQVAQPAGAKSKPAREAPPHELAMQHLPDYRIEPPDVISLEMLKMVPLPPYRAAIFDVLKIHANALPDHPIDNNFIVGIEGKVDLGPNYGSVRVVGMTIDEMVTALNKSLRQVLREPAVGVQLAQVSGAQPITGQYLVGPDGTVNLRQYGRVCVAGKTVTEARIAIMDHLKQFLDSPELSVDVVAYNSKVYYLITQGAGLGDNVRRLPSTGKETVLDAISQVNGLSQVSDKNKIWIVRPSPAAPEKATILPVDWDGISSRGVTTTNYQIFPGDRLYIGQDCLVTRTNLIGKKTAPVERIMGILGLTSNTLAGLNGMTAADSAVLKELVRKGVFTEDEEMKGILLETIRLTELEREKAHVQEAQKKL